jgi:hypothetical protein
LGKVILFHMKQIYDSFLSLQHKTWSRLYYEMSQTPNKYLRTGRRVIHIVGRQMNWAKNNLTT